MLISIIYITKRPGGYDILLNSLAQQTSKNYELICIDELANYRKEKIKTMAEKLNVNLKIVRPGKEKTFPDTKFGICNAFNTGLLEASGEVILFLQDYCWLPANIMEKIEEFYQENPDSLLSFCEKYYQAPNVDKNKFSDNTALTIYDKELDTTQENRG